MRRCVGGKKWRKKFKIPCAVRPPCYPRFIGVPSTSEVLTRKEIGVPSRLYCRTPSSQESAGKSGLKLASSSLAAQLFTVHGDPWEWAEGCPAATLSESEASLDSKHRYARDEYVLGSQRTSSCDATLTPLTETPPPLGSQTHRSSFARLSACCARGLRTRSGSLSGPISGRCSLVRM